MDRRLSITVALPTYNGARHLREALAGLRDQGDVDFDLVVSDDRSDDATLKIVHEELGDRARISVNSEPLGLAGNWNRCVELSRTDWVAIFHQDDVMHPGHLTNHQRLIEAFPSYQLGLIAGPVLMIDELGRPVLPLKVDPGGLVIEDRSSAIEVGAGIILPPGGLLATLTVTNPLRCSGVTIRKEAHEAVGGFDPSYQYAVDWDFWIRVGRDWAFAWSTGPATVSMRWHPASETHRFQTGTVDLDEQVRLLAQLDQGGKARRFDRKAANARLARAFLNRAHIALKASNSILARECLVRSVRMSRRIYWNLALDPRLAIQMATLALSPDRAKKWFGRDQ